MKKTHFSILAGNSNSGLSYLITTVLLSKWVDRVKVFTKVSYFYHSENWLLKKGTGLVFAFEKVLSSLTCLSTHHSEGSYFYVHMCIRSICHWSIEKLSKNTFLGKKSDSGHRYPRANVWCIKIRTKDSSNTLLSLVRFLMHQTLFSTSLQKEEHVYWSTLLFIWPFVYFFFLEQTLYL